jgi:hypothetical protein
MRRAILLLPVLAATLGAASGVALTVTGKQALATTSSRAPMVLSILGRVRQRPHERRLGLRRPVSRNAKPAGQDLVVCGAGTDVAHVNQAGGLGQRSIEELGSAL